MKRLEKALIQYGSALVQLKLVTLRLQVAKAKGDKYAKSAYRFAALAEGIDHDELFRLLDNSKEEARVARSWMEMYADQYLAEGGKDAKEFSVWMKRQWKEAL